VAGFWLQAYVCHGPTTVNIYTLKITFPDLVTTYHVSSLNSKCRKGANSMDNGAANGLCLFCDEWNAPL
jgi:hypothetical protein